MKHFIYKLIHKNGKYYIGRHSTENIDDGYMGSGKWPRSIKDKSSLTREILEYAPDLETLKQLEGQYLIEHFGKPGCMNLTSDPVGFGTENNPMKNPDVIAKLSGDNHWLRQDPSRIEEIKKHQAKLVRDGKHNFVGNKNPNKGGTISRKTAQSGRNVFQTNNPSIWRSEQGIHHWQNGKSPNFEGALNKKLIEEGRHNFLGPETNNRRIAEGTHNFLGSSSNERMLADGRHPSQLKKTCPHCNKKTSIGMYKRWHGDNCKQHKNN